MLVLSKYDFYHHVDQRTQEMMHAYAKKFYLSDSAIRHSIQEQYRWEEYKKSLLDGVTARRSRADSPRRSARGQA